MTLNQYLQLFTDISQAHKQVKYFGFGPIHEYLDSNVNTELGQHLWLEIDKSNITGGVKVNSFNLYCMDYVNKDITNRNEVLSDAERTLGDVIALLNNPYYYDFFELDENFQFTVFYDDKTANEACGWWCTIGLKQDFIYDSCAVPIDGIPTGSGTYVINTPWNGSVNFSDLHGSPYDNSNLAAALNLKADKSTTLTINGTTYDLSANRSWTIVAGGENLNQTLINGKSTSGQDIILTNNDLIRSSAGNVTIGFGGTGSGEYLDLISASGAEVYVGNGYGVYISQDLTGLRYIDLTSAGIGIVHTGDFDISLGGEMHLIGGLKLASLTANTIPYIDNTNIVRSGMNASYLDATSSIQTQLNARELSANKGIAGGYASLDGGGKVPATQLPNTVMELQGNWNASTNTPTLADGTGNPGDVYEVTVAGTQNLGSGAITFAVGDWAVYGASGVWHKSLNSNAVTSVNGFTGTVVLSTTDISEGANLYFTNARVNTQVATYTGDVTLSGTAFSIGAGKVTNTMLAGNIAASKLIGTDIATVGTITVGTWQGGSINTTYTDAKIKGSISATAGLIGYGNGTADTLTTLSTFKYDATNNALLVGIGAVLASADVANLIKDQNAATALRIRNNNASGSSQAFLQLSNGTTALNFGHTGTGFTPSGVIGTNTSYLQAAGAGGLIFEAIDAAGKIQFTTGGTTVRHIIESNGNMALGATGSYGSGVGVFFMANGTAPSSNPIGGGILYVESGSLKFRGSSGTVTLLGAA